MNTRFMLKAHIRQLRQKIEPDPGQPIYLLTVPGVGYQLVL
jgi:DNA-binding response OmpR family regulator